MSATSPADGNVDNAIYNFGSSIPPQMCPAEVIGADNSMYEFASPAPLHSFAPSFRSRGTPSTTLDFDLLSRCISGFIRQFNIPSNSDYNLDFETIHIGC
ncbi:hypothetical protein B0H19DRAFT_1271092 [Mycena capillaripes]|nr:hypothetical protein B0H19DRAFT_1271092 [Mycena capillaripes]